MLSRIWIAVLTVGLMALVTGGVIAQDGDGGSNGQSAAKSEYKPGFGPCPNDGTNPSGTHTGPPGQEGANCETKPGNSASSSAACRTGTSYVVRPRGPRGTRLKKVKVWVNGRRVRVRRGRAVVPVTQGASARKSIVVQGVTKRGTRVRGRRQFNPCATPKDPTVRTKRTKRAKRTRG